MTPKRKRGRPVGPDGKRLYLSKKTLVSPVSLAFLKACQRGLGVPYGRTIDALIQYAREKRDFRLPLNNSLPNLQTWTTQVTPSQSGSEALTGNASESLPT